MGLRNALNNRPVRAIGFILALQSATYGLGISTGLGGFSETLLFSTIESSSVTISFGICMILAGLLLAFAYARNNPKTIKVASSACGTVWLFAVFIYLLDGAWLLALAVSLPWALLAFYLAYAHGNRLAIIDYDQTPRAQYDTAHEDQL